MPKIMVEVEIDYEYDDDQWTTPPGPDNVISYMVNQLELGAYECENASIFILNVSSPNGHNWIGSRLINILAKEKPVVSTVISKVEGEVHDIIINEFDTNSIDFIVGPPYRGVRWISIEETLKDEYAGTYTTVEGETFDLGNGDIDVLDNENEFILRVYGYAFKHEVK